MSSNAPKRKKVDVVRIWVDKATIRLAWSTLSESQKAAISASICKSLPDDYEMFPTDELKDILQSASVEWRDAKIKQKVPIAPAVPAC